MSALSDLQASVPLLANAVTTLAAARATDKQTIADLQNQVEALTTQANDSAELVALNTEVVAATQAATAAAQ